MFQGCTNVLDRLFNGLIEALKCINSFGSSDLLDTVYSTLARLISQATQIQTVHHPATTRLQRANARFLSEPLGIASPPRPSPVI